VAMARARGKGRTVIALDQNARIKKMRSFAFQVQ